MFDENGRFCHDYARRIYNFFNKNIAFIGSKNSPFSPHLLICFRLAEHEVKEEEKKRLKTTTPPKVEKKFNIESNIISDSGKRSIQLSKL